MLLPDGYRPLRLADSLSTVECYELPPNAAVFPLWQQLQECLESTRLLLGANGRTYMISRRRMTWWGRCRNAYAGYSASHLQWPDAADDATAPVTVRGSVAVGSGHPHHPR